MPDKGPSGPIRRLPTNLQHHRPQPAARPIQHHPSPSGHPHQPNPVAHTPAAHHPDHHQAAAVKNKPKKRKWLKAMILLIIIAAIAGGAVYAYPRYIDKNPFPANIQTNAEFSLLYPKKLPTGYAIDNSTIQLTNGVLLYAANNGDKKLVFTTQKTPPTFNFTEFYKEQLQSSRQIDTNYGEATVGTNSGHVIGSLVAGNTWVIVSTTDSHLNQSDFIEVLKNLKRY